MYKIRKPKETTNKHGSCQWLWGKKRVTPLGYKIIPPSSTSRQLEHFFSPFAL